MTATETNKDNDDSVVQGGNETQEIDEAHGHGVDSSRITDATTEQTSSAAKILPSQEALLSSATKASDCDLARDDKDAPAAVQRVIPLDRGGDEKSSEKLLLAVPPPPLGSIASAAADAASFENPFYLVPPVLQPGASRVYPLNRQEYQEPTDDDDQEDYARTVIDHPNAGTSRAAGTRPLIAEEEDFDESSRGVIILRAEVVGSDEEEQSYAAVSRATQYSESVAAKHVQGFYVNRKMTLCFVLCFILLVCIVGAVVGATNKNKRVAAPAPQSTVSPSPFLETNIERYARTLPNYTQAVLRNELKDDSGAVDELQAASGSLDWYGNKRWTNNTSFQPKSPQGKAWKWLLSDPNLLTRSLREINIRFALSTFFFATDGPNWKNNTNWLSTTHDVCDWRTDNEDAINAYKQYMTRCEPAGFAELLLVDNNLVGSIPPELGLLSGLLTVKLAANALHGEVPEVVWQSWKSMYTLHLYDNKLEGTISNSLRLCTHLYYLDLHDNLFTGTLPSGIGSSPGYLWYVFLAGNQFTGPLPTEIGRLKALKTFLALNNSFTGSVPTEIGNLKNLEYLSLENNRFSGSIPSQIARCKELTYMTVDSNSLSGTLPSILSRLPSLRTFSVRNNSLSGTLPSQLGALTALMEFDVSANRISGTLPNDTDKLVRLISLGLSRTELTGRIPKSVCEAFSLRNESHLISIDCDRVRCACNCSCETAN